MRLLILGSGYLGRKYHACFRDCSVLAEGFRVQDHDDVVRIIQRHHADAVLNCAGKTGQPHIDWCETHKEETLHANLTVPLIICRACAQTGTRLVHLGTGGIYQGHNRREDEAPDFIHSYYGKTKYLAEEALKDFDTLQLRIMMPTDGIPHPKNLLTKLLAYPETINELNSITVIPDLMEATRQLIERKACGIFNVVNPEPVTTTDILNLYNAHAGRKKVVREIPMSRLQEMVRAPRPVCTLSTVKLEKAGVRLRTARAAVEECVKEYVALEEPILSSIPV